MKCTRYILAALASCFLMTTASAAILVSDIFRDGERSNAGTTAYSENGIDSDNDGDLESQWFIQNNGGSNSMVAGGISIQPPTGSMNWTTYFSPDGSPITLANPGDTLRLTMDFTPTGVNASNTSQAFRFAVVESPARLTTDAGPANGVYDGYAIFSNMGQTLGNSNPFALRRRTQAASGPILNNDGDWGGSAGTLANGATTGADGYDDGVLYTMNWIMTRTAANELAFDVSISGGTLDGDGLAQVLYTDATPNTFTFDTLNFRPSQSAQTATDFLISRFEVEFSNAIPEPMSLTLLGLSALACVLRRQR